jgi:hypothetical protein
LRDRIAAAITDALADQKHWQGELFPHNLADAVIAELGDWTNWMDTVFVDFGLWLAEEITGRQMTRIDMESCVTDWKADDE